MSAQTELPIGPAAERWPRLSRSLPFPRRLDRCQACGLGPDPAGRRGIGGTETPPGGEPFATLPRWMEHDDQDRPEPIVVVLCDPCAERIIEPHPRLYDRVPLYKPFPGAMGICVGCTHNDRLACRSPEARFNGGPGLEIEHPPQGVMHICTRGRGGGRGGGWIELYSGPATACSGREPAVQPPREEES